MTAITVTLLGTGSPLPDPNRARPSTLVKAEWIDIAARHFAGEIIAGPDLTSIDC